MTQRTKRKMDSNEICWKIISSTLVKW